jgi:[amino group carrier protein]-L-2-aminoadipate/L-glutamate 6-kinase
MGKETQSILVVKLGGTEGVDFSAICKDVAEMVSDGKSVVLVHGGSAEANALGTALGCPPQFLTSPSGYTSRYTDMKTLEVFTMAVNGKINTQLVSQLQSIGVNAFGLSGLDGQLMKAKRKDAIRSIKNGKRLVIRDDQSGKITQVDTGLLKILLNAGYVPVIAPLAMGEHGEALNTDADRAAAMVAASLQAEILVLLTAVPGLMQDFPDETTLVSQIQLSQMEEAMQFAKGRMKKKILGAGEALKGGVKHVVIADGRSSHPVQMALAGQGTWIHS